MGVQSWETAACCANRSFSFRRVSETALIVLTILLSSPAFAQPPIKVEWKEGRLSVVAENVPLSRVLAEVARLTGIELEGIEQLQEKVDIHLSGVVLTEGLQNLLAHADYAIRYGSGPEGAHRLQVVVFGQRGVLKVQNGAPSEVKTVTQPARIEAEPPRPQIGAREQKLVAPAAPQADDDRPRKATADPDSAYVSGPQDVRALRPEVANDDSAEQVQALHQLLGSSNQANQPASLNALSDALESNNHTVQTEAIQALAGQGSSQAMELLQEAFGSSDPAVRLAVLQSVGESNQGLPFLQQAVSDPDPSVSAFASELLKAISSSEPGGISGLSGND